MGYVTIAQYAFLYAIPMSLCIHFTTNADILKRFAKSNLQLCCNLLQLFQLQAQPYKEAAILMEREGFPYLRF